MPIICQRKGFDLSLYLIYGHLGEPNTINQIVLACIDKNWGALNNILHNALQVFYKCTFGDRTVSNYIHQGLLFCSILIWKTLDIWSLFEELRNSHLSPCHIIEVQSFWSFQTRHQFSPSNRVDKDHNGLFHMFPVTQICTASSFQWSQESL